MQVPNVHDLADVTLLHGKVDWPCDALLANSPAGFLDRATPMFTSVGTTDGSRGCKVTDPDCQRLNIR